MNRDQFGDDMLDVALEWHIRLQSPDISADVWADFAAWLEKDDRHNLAYDQIAGSDRELDHWAKNHRESETADPVAANDDQPLKRWFSYGGIGLAASILLAIFIWPQISGPEFRTITTDPGETEIVEMDDGSKIHINGDSEIKLKSDGSRYAELRRGEAIFHVRHDARNPFLVLSDGYELIDRGTIFNVRQVDGEISIGVSEGAVLLKGKQKLVDIPAGKILTISKDGNAVLKPVILSNVGSWTRGQLVYDLAPISVVIADINRNTNLMLTVDPAIANRQFSGSIQLTGESELLVNRLEKLLDLKAKDTTPGWHLTR